MQISVDLSQLKTLPADVRRGMEKAFPAAVKKVVQITRHEQPERSGHLRDQTHAEFTGPLRADIVATALNNGFDYGEGLTTGTGLFGPNRRRIYPKKSRALNTPYGPRLSIAGMPANRYDLRAANRAGNDAPEAFEQALPRW